MIRLTNLGIRQVNASTVEAARSFGASPLQILTKVQMPMALPTIMAGINQTTMMALAMVTIASLVAAGGLGDNVLRALQKNEYGNGIIAGLAIVFLGIIFDRLTQARSPQPTGSPVLTATNRLQRAENECGGKRRLTLSNGLALI